MKRVGDSTLAEHEAYLEEQGVRVKDDAATPELPPLAAHLWRTFMELHAYRPAGMSGREPLTASNISAWCGLTGVVLSPWEVDGIKQVDLCWLTSER